MLSSELNRQQPVVAQVAVDAAEQPRAHRQRELPQRVEAADGAAAMQCLHCEDQQLSHGFRSCHGLRRSTITTRPMR